MKPTLQLLLPALTMCLFAACSKPPQATVDRGVLTQDGVSVGAPGKKKVELADLDGYNVPAHLREQIANSAAFARSEDIVWTTPDQTEDALSEELQEILGRERKDDGPWLRSYRRAVSKAQGEGKPLLIWFTDSRRSALCKKIDRDVFAKPGFEEWAQDRIVKVAVDKEVGDRTSLDSEGAQAAARYKYNEKLRRKYKVLGYPTIILQMPDGRIKRTMRGFTNADSELYFGQLQGDVKEAQEEIASWRASLQAKGYRDWKSRDGASIFCKLVKYTPERVTLVNAMGRRYKVPVSRLSAADQAWLEAEKGRRGY